MRSDAGNNQAYIKLKLDGLCPRADGQILLLLRNSRHNDKTWGLPGGNIEAGDSNLLATATREAAEELGTLPTFEVLTEILTK